MLALTELTASATPERDDQGMKSWQKWAAAGIAVFYLIFWMGGNYSFQFTHTCVRSHQELREVPDGQGDSIEKYVTVCDYYTANGRRWSFGDPARSLATTWVGTWTNAAFFAGIGCLVVGYRWKKRRDALKLQAMYESSDEP